MLNGEHSRESTDRPDAPRTPAEPAMLREPPAKVDQASETPPLDDATVDQIRGLVRAMVEPMLKQHGKDLHDAIFAGLRREGALPPRGGAGRRVLAAEEAVDRARVEHAAELERVRAEHAAELERLKAEHRGERTDLIREVATRTRELLLAKE